MREGAGRGRERGRLARNNRLTTREEPHVKNRRPSALAHCLVLAGPAIAVLFTLCVLASGRGACLLSAAWLLAAVWSFLTALAGALWRGIRHHDWSAFACCALPERNDDRFEWETRSGRYAWCRDYEEGGLYDDDAPFGHGPIT